MRLNETVHRFVAIHKRTRKYALIEWFNVDVTLALEEHVEIASLIWVPHMVEASLYKEHRDLYRDLEHSGIKLTDCLIEEIDLTYTLKANTIAT